MSSNLIVSPKYVSKEKRAREEVLSNKDWLSKVISNKGMNEVFLRSQLGSVEYKTLNNLNYQVCILDLKKADKQNKKSLAHTYKGIVKAIFEQHSFRVFLSERDNQLVIAAFDLFVCKTRKEQLEKKELFRGIVNQLSRLFNYKENDILIYMSVSAANKGFRNIFRSYEEAVKALLMKKHFNTSTIFYDDLGAFQILLNLQEKDLLEAYVLRHLGPIIEEDRKKNSDLLKTLKIYLERDGSKQSVANELHIVRQSLYYRLEKIKELLGEDYMCTQNRLALQLAIQAYELLNANMMKI